MKPRLTWILAATYVVWSTPAFASTMPRADFPAGRPTLGIGAGQGVGLALDAPIAPNWTLGASAGSRWGVGANADLRALWRFWQVGRDPTNLALLVGAQAGGPAFHTITTVSPMVGVAFAHPIAPRWTLRGNLVFGVLGPDSFRPAGIEVAYKFDPKVEGTIGFNGRGDFLGIKLLI